MFEGQQGKQKTEIQFDASTGIVTMKLLVQDPQGYFIPNIRRDNFVVYENGVRQTNLDVEIERATASLALLVEFGGQFQRMSKILDVEVENACSQLLAELGQEDKLALFKYGDTVVQLADFSQPRETLNRAISLLGTPSDQANLYDALVFTLERVRPIVDRKSITLISSGIDTFSKAKYEDVLESVAKLEIVDSKGKTIRAKVIAEQTYTPSASVQRRTSLEGQR